MMASSIGGKAGREVSAKLAVADQISQSVQSTSNILHLMIQSSKSQPQLMKLPRNLVAKTSVIKNTEFVLQQMPRVISSLDEHVEIGLRSAPHLNTVVQLLSNMRSVQLKSLSATLDEKPKLLEQGLDCQPSKRDMNI